MVWKKFILKCLSLRTLGNPYAIQNFSLHRWESKANRKEKRAVILFSRRDWIVYKAGALEIWLVSDSEWVTLGAWHRKKEVSCHLIPDPRWLLRIWRILLTSASVFDALRNQLQRARHCLNTSLFNFLMPPYFSIWICQTRVKFLC